MRERSAGAAWASPAFGDLLDSSLGKHVIQNNQVSMREVEITLEDCRQRDREDPLADWRRHFDLPPELCYLDGNSLGPLTHAARERVLEVTTQQWGTGLIRSWNEAGWFDASTRLGARLAPLIGAEQGEVLFTDSMSVNLYKLLVGFLRRRTGTKMILAEAESFPTDLYVADSVAELVPGTTVQRCDAHDGELIDAIHDEVAVVYVSHVDYRTARMHDMSAITARAHEVGAVVLWNLAHSAGAVPLELSQWRVDAAVGCGYKYLNGGPGAPSFIYLAQRHQATLDQPLQGWFGHARPFEFEPRYEPAADLKRFLCGTPPILSMAALEASLEIWQAVDLQQVRRKSIELSELFWQLVKQRCHGLGLELASPVDPAQRGSHISLRHEHAYAVMQALIAEGVIGDFRAPNLLRFGFAPLYVRFEDLWTATASLASILTTKSYLRSEFQGRRAVT